MTQQSELKKLQFVPEYGNKGYEIANNLYSTVKTNLPAPVKENVNKIEESVAAVSAPYIAKAQDKGTELLKVVDDQVDKAVQSASIVYQNNSAYVQSQLDKQLANHQQNLESFKSAREAYLKKVEESVAFVKSNGITGAAKIAADEVTAKVAEARKLPGMLMSGVQQAFDRFMSYEPVQKALTNARPAVDAAYSRYMSVHDSVVASPQYKRAFDLSQSAIARAQETMLYRKTMDTFYPLVAKYATPAMEQIAGNPYYKAAIEHVQPKPVNAQ